MIKLPRSLDALKDRNYQKIFVASLTSNIGSWVETVVIGIFLQLLTGSAALVGFAYAMRFAANVFVAPLGGWCADHFDRKKLLIATNFVSSIMALGIGFMVSRGGIHSAVLIGFVGLTGILDSINFPTYQAFVSELVPKKIYAGALSLIFSGWNLARILGPIAAGLLVSKENFEFAFYVNAASFWAVIVGLLSIKKLNNVRDKKIKATWKQGASWLFVNQKLGRVVAIHSVSVLFAGGLIAVVPNIADEVYGSRVFGTTMINVFMAIGAIFVTIMHASLTNNFGVNKTLSILAKLTPFSLLAFGLAPNLFLACIAVSFFGLSHLGTLTGIITEIQLIAPAELKGKIASVFSSILGGAFLLSSLAYGFIIDNYGSVQAFTVMAVLHFLTQLAIGLYSKNWGIKHHSQTPGSVPGAI